MIDAYVELVRKDGIRNIDDVVVVLENVRVALVWQRIKLKNDRRHPIELVLRDHVPRERRSVHIGDVGQAVEVSVAHALRWNRLMQRGSSAKAHAFVVHKEKCAFL